jgi:hypothetical protein
LTFDEHDVEIVMQRNNQWLVMMLIIAGLQFLACQQKAEEAPAPIVPTTRGQYSGQALHRVRLTAKRAEELGIKTAPVREEKISGKLCKVIPAVAVVQDQQGNVWAFKSPDSLVFIRERISVDNVVGDLAVLSEGPAVGTAVVTAGAAQLLKDAFSEITEGTAESKTSMDGKGEKSSGTATMLENGNLKVVHRAAGVSGLTASVVIEYKPTDEEYQKILDQIGGLKAGETKSLPPLPEK